MTTQQVKYNLCQGSGTYGPRARGGSFERLAWYFLNAIVTKLFL